MKSKQFFTHLAATTAAITTIATLVITLHGCGGTNTGGDLPAFDLAAAIDNPRPFDLADISDEISFIPLDDSRREGLLGDIRSLVQSQGRFWIYDANQETVVKVFDRDGGFISTMGRYGRGPDEFMGLVNIAADHDRDLIYMSGRTGSMQPATMALDTEGRRVAHADSLQAGGGITGGGMALYDGRLVVRRTSPNSIDFGDNPDFVTSVGTRVPLLDVYSSDMQTKIETITTIDKGTASLIDIQTDASGNPLSISVYMGGADIMANAGDRLVVKESLSDTVMHYRDGALRPAYTLPTGKYTTPPETWGVNNTSRVSGEFYTVKSVMESDRWVIVQVAPVLNTNLDAMRLVFDRSDPDTGGFAVTDGTSPTSNLMLDGLPVTPMQILDGQLLGYIPALAIYDNADRLTNPDLKAAATTIREDSNPILVVATLK